MQWYQLETTEIVAELKTDLKKGLSSEQVEKKRESFGYNELVGQKGPSIWDMIFAQLKNFLTLILITSSIISFAVGEATDAIVILIVVILNTALGVSQESRANKALEALKQMASPKSKVIRNSQTLEIPSQELVPGDLVILETGDYIPADLRLIESVNLKIDESSLTGESVPVEKNARDVITEQVSIGDRHNSAFMGTIITYGRGRGIVVNTGMKTEIGQIAEMLESYEENETPLQKKLAEFGKLLGYIALAVVVLVFILGVLRQEPLLQMFMTSISLAVAAIPEGLPAIVTIVLALGMKKMIQRHVIIKRLHAVETLGSVTTICSDKTGTLTKNAMTVVAIHSDQKTFNVTGKGYSPEGEFLYDEQEINLEAYPDLLLLLKICALNNDAQLKKAEDGHWKIIGDPTEGSLLVAAAKAQYDLDKISELNPRIQELPFDSDRKRMTTFHQNPDEKNYYAFVKGAPDITLSLCTKVYQKGSSVPLTAEKKSKILKVNSDMASQSLRVLALAYREIEEIPENPTPEEMETELVFVGLVGMIDPARPEAIEAIRTCKSAGIRPVMITGDYKETAVAIAQELGIIEDEKAITGPELEKISTDDLAKSVQEVSVFARVSPEHKVKIVEALKSTGQIVSMTGDGVNDAPALKKADIGVAMGITGTDVAKETADMILTDDNFASIVSAVEEGRVIYSNIRKFIFFLLSCNVAELMIIFFAMLVGWPIPLEPIQILWLNLVTDAFPALALGMEPAEPNVMQKMPRDPKESIINRKMSRGIIIQSVAMTIAVLGIFRVIHQGTGDIHIARNFAFITLVVSELFRAFTARSEDLSVFKLGFFSNKFVIGGTLISFLLMLAVVYIPFLQPVFGTQALNLSEWGLVLLYSLIPAVVAELSKVFNHLRKTKS